MTSRERVVIAMNRGEPDRVPLMCQLSMGHYFVQLGVDPAEYWVDNQIIADCYVQLADRYGFDGILVNLPGRSPEARQHIDRVEETATGKVIHYVDGGRCVCPFDDLPVHESVAQLPLQQVDPEELYYEDPHTLGGLKYPFHYDFAPAEQYFPPHVFEIIDRVLERAGQRLSVHSEVFSPFTQLMERLGYENGLMALLEDPDRCKAILERFAAGSADLASQQARRGVDAVLISSAFAGGGFVSREMYREFVLPYEAIVAASIRAAGVKAYTHTCGAIGDRLEQMAETGIDGIDTMDPPPLGDTELGDAKRRVGARIFLKGNIDPVNILLRGSVEDVRRNAVEKLEMAAAGGGYILSSACSVAPHVPPENLAVLREVVEEYGRY